MKRTLVMLFLVATLFSYYRPATSAQEAVDKVTRAKVIKAVEEAISTLASGDVRALSQQLPDVKLLSVKVSKKKKEITLNFSKEMLEYGVDDQMELALEHILTSVSNVVDWQETDFKIQIDGTPLREIFAPRDAPAIKQSVPPKEAVSEQDEFTTLGLSGKRVVISPGHGWYYLESDGTYHLQRSYFNGIVEDFVNAEMVMYLNSQLTATGADVRPARNMNKNAGTGETNHPKWEEAAKYHIKALGAPATVYNNGSSDLAKDINSRPLYANYVASDILVSVHNNGGGGTGTETWYDSTNASNVESRRLATILHNKVVTRIRQEYDSNWTDRGLKSCDACKGENRLATRPAVILEVAFMDRQSPDNQYLHDERFKQLVARAIREGIEEYLGSGTGSGDAWDPGDDTGYGATQLNNPTGTQQSHGTHTLSSNDRYDWFKLYLIGGNQYQLDSIGGSGDDYGELFTDPGGTNRVAYDDDAGGNMQFKIPYTPPSTGYYYLRVRAYSLGAACSYTLHYMQTSSAGSPRAVVSSGLRLSPGNGPYYVGQTISGNFTVVNRGNANLVMSRLLIGGRLNGGCPNGCPDFSSATGITLAPGQSYSYSGSLTLPSTGNYGFFATYQRPDGTWNTNLDVENGATNNVSISAQTSPPRLTGHSPPTIYASPYDQTVYFSGSGLTNTIYMYVQFPNGSGAYIYPPGQIFSRSYNQLGCKITFGGRGQYYVWAYTSDGGWTNADPVWAN
jgi:N-acetylmuramoyl-L-alanine amidase